MSWRPYFSAAFKIGFFASLTLLGTLSAYASRRRRHIIDGIYFGALLFLLLLLVNTLVMLGLTNVISGLTN